MRYAAAALVLLASTAHAELTVSVVADGRLDVRGRAPLSDVLDEIGRRTGMKIVYDGAPPRQVVTVDAKGALPSDVVLELLKANAIPHAAAVEPGGARVRTILVLGAGAEMNVLRVSQPGPAPDRDAGPVAAAPAPEPVPQPVADAEDGKDDEESEDEGVRALYMLSAPAAGTPPPGPGSPVWPQDGPVESASVPAPAPFVGTDRPPTQGTPVSGGTEPFGEVTPAPAEPDKKQE